jgi:hypothetical protein
MQQVGPGTACCTELRCMWVLWCLAWDQQQQQHSSNAPRLNCLQIGSNRRRHVVHNCANVATEQWVRCRCGSGLLNSQALGTQKLQLPSLMPMKVVQV